MKPTTAPDSFFACDLRIGTVVAAESLPKARKPAWVLQIDFGPLGTLKSSAQLTMRYTPENLIGRQVVAVVNFPPLQVGNLQSQCLVLGGIPGEGDVVLLEPGEPVPNGPVVS